VETLLEAKFCSKFGTASRSIGYRCSTKEQPVAKKPKKLEDLFHETLKDIYFAENKILKTLPKMAKAAQSKELKAAFALHERETRGQVKRLDRVFKIIGKPARGKTCAAINGITEEGSEIMKDFKGMPALDAGLLAAAQAVEHYEISRYGTLSTWAEELGYAEAVDLLEATLQEEKNTDKTLTGIAKSVVNIEAEEDEQEGA
jgi:ferritin-like metal-binding protein YciE